MIIRADNLLHLNAPKTYLSNPEVSGTNVLRWKNPSGFQLSWAIQIGEVGAEQTEVAVLTTGNPVGGTAGTITTNSLYEHPADTTVIAIKYNQVVFERNTGGTIGGTSAPMTDGTVTYQADHLFTQFDDVSGSASYGYRARFRNSVSGSQTSLSDWILSPGFSFYSLAEIRQRSKDKMWDATFIQDDLVWDRWTNEFKDKLTNAAIQVNEDYSLGTVDVGFGTDGLGTVTTGDFKQPRRVWVKYAGNDFVESTKQESNDDFPNRTYVSTRPEHYWFGNDIIQVKPEESGGTARIMFYRQGTTMVNDTDELPRYMRGYTDGFVDYNLIQAQYKDGKMTMSEKKLAESSLIREFTGQLTPRDKSGADRINIVEAISSDDSLV